MDYISANVGVDRSSRFPSRAWTDEHMHTQRDKQKQLPNHAGGVSN